MTADENSEPETSAETAARGTNTAGAITASTEDEDSPTEASAQGLTYYTGIVLEPCPQDPHYLGFVAAKDYPLEPPDDLRALRRDFERTARVVSILFEGDQEMRREIFMLLHQSADRGLRGPRFSIQDGRANLLSVRERITDDAHKVRDKQLREYTQLLGIFGVVPLLVGVVVFLTSGFGWLQQPSANQPYDPLFAWILATLWIPAGATICVWGEFALRMQTRLSYEQLLNMDPSRWRPKQRLLITVGISFILAFLLAYEAVQIGVGNLLLNDFADKTPAMALAVGGVTGLAFPKVRDIIYSMRPKE